MQIIVSLAMALTIGANTSITIVSVVGGQGACPIIFHTKVYVLPAIRPVIAVLFWAAVTIVADGPFI